MKVRVLGCSGGKKQVESAFLDKDLALAKIAFHYWRRI